MLVLLPAIALLALWLALVSRGLDWRRAVVQTLLAGGLWVWALTEGLSLVAWLGKPALAVGWAVALIAAALAIGREALPKRLHLAKRPRPDRLLLIATTGVIVFSDGASFRFAKAMGHTIVPLHTALAPLLTQDAAWHELAGVTAPVEITAERAGRPGVVG